VNTVEKEEKRLTRRDFVKGSAVGGAAGLAVAVGGTALLTAGKPRPWLPQKWNYEADVVVVGTGYAGLNAAIASHDAGAKVLVLEKAPERFAGGNSGVSGGGLRIPTNVPDAIKYYRSLCFGTVPDDLCVDLAEAMIRVPEQLKKLGIEIAPLRFSAGAPSAPAKRPASTAPLPAPSARQPSGLSLLPGSASASLYTIVPPGEKGPRMGSGYELYLALKRCVESRGIKVLYEVPVKELIQDPETKAILGVVAEENGKKTNIKAKRAVVLACGGYEANYEMQGYFNYPGMKIYPWGTPYNTGDGIKMVSEIGAPLWHMFNIEWDAPCVKVPSEKYGVSVQTGIGSGTFGSFVFVNKYGRRFMNEVKNLAHTKESLELTHFNHERVEYPNLPFYIVFDETFRLKYQLVPKKTMCWNGVYKIYEWSTDNSAEIAKGWIIKADTIKELATKTGIDPAGSEETVAKYNEYCKSGKDAAFDRRKESLLPIETPPYYSAELALTCINTQGGPKHNGKAQTLDKDGKPIPRLYTPGEFGSFFGFLYPGGSNIPEAISFGRIAGEKAAAEKAWS
jgi:succinate dehydrogenase/fumarate reductase flavoprotein subunit